MLHNNNKISSFIEFVIASQNGDYAKIEYLIKERKLPLLFACSIGDRNLVEFMIKHGANVNFVSKNGKNALTTAYKNDHRHLFDTLISNGANFKCQHGFLILLENCKREEMDDFEFLLKHDAPTNGFEVNGMCPLMEASQNGYTQKVDLLLKYSLDELNRCNKHGFSSLRLACMNTHQEVVSLLIEHGADMDSRDKNGKTALIDAIKNLDNYHVSSKNRLDHLKLAIFLIEKGADPNSVDKNGNSVLSVAAKSTLSVIHHQSEIDSLILIIKLLIMKGANLNFQNSYGETALMLFCKRWRDSFNPIIKLMLEKNADANLQKRDGNTALMLAFESKRFDKANLLIDHGANLNIANKEENTALMIAVSITCDVLIVKTMIEKGADVNVYNKNGDTSLMLALEFRRFDKAQLLIDYGVDLNMVNEKGNTALMVAIKNFCNLSMIKMMVNRGANINKQNLDGNTALMFLLQIDSSEIQVDTVKFLIEKKAHLKLVNKNKQNSLFLAVLNNRKKYFNMIVDTNIINLNDQDDKGNTLLHYACSNQRREHLAKLLIKHGVNLNMKNVKGNTALVLAIENFCESSLIEMMIKKGADINVQNNEGKTPLMCSLLKENLQSSQILIENGANLNQRDKEGKTAFYYALVNSLNEIVILLIEKGAHLHYKWQERRLIDNLDKKNSNCNNQTLLIYRNALVKELSETFKYEDYEGFKSSVIESIENEQMAILEYDHIKALNHLLSQEKHWFEEERTQFKSMEFREKLIVDYLNVLNDQKKLLEIVKLKLFAMFPHFKENFEKQTDSNNQSIHINLKNIVSQDAVDILMNSIHLNDSPDQQMRQFKFVIEKIEKYIEIISNKTSLADQLIQLVESK